MSRGAGKEMGRPDVRYRSPILRMFRTKWRVAHPFRIFNLMLTKVWVPQSFAKQRVGALLVEIPSNPTLAPSARGKAHSQQRMGHPGSSRGRENGGRVGHPA
jgi:hypothetical protein